MEHNIRIRSKYSQFLLILIKQEQNKMPGTLACYWEEKFIEERDLDKMGFLTSRETEKNKE